ncbi:PepSY domain-containing protein [Odoribacter sp. OttesenSCG-928-J03]|nr:PepSY domain-containing protein [Odoribacter sp. OttesenSCG-928-J03]MDL2282989.1 PepSY domain-containing protein [Odoribacter sp. OttesenSCG-928-G04]
MEIKIKRHSSSKKMKKWHKWTGILFAFFIFIFAFSGVFLNHRKALSSLDVPRAGLFSAYRYQNWNNGSVKGSFKLSPDLVLLYGGNGIWLTDTLHTTFSSFSKGMKKGADNNIVSNIIRTQDSSFFAVTTFDLYQLDPLSLSWKNLSDRIGAKERFVDIAAFDDTLVVMTRSHVYLATSPYTQFIQKELPAPEGYKKETSWFRIMWTLHSGELFGIPGKVVVDILGILTMILCVTGVILAFFPQIIRRKKRKGANARKSISLFKGSLKWHNKLGASFIILFLLLCITGMFLRPPLLIAIIRGKTSPLPGTSLNSPNPWFDKLRCLHYDSFDKEWILYSSEGFYTLKTLDSEPQKIKKSPPVSVMGVTVLQQTDSCHWIVGSFSGIYEWNKQTGESIDYITGKPVEKRRPGIPNLTNAVGGYSADFGNKKLVFKYESGAGTLDGDDFAIMPDMFKKGRMSFWHLCLEVHVGRIYSPLLGVVSDLFVFLSGVIFLIILLTGYVIYRRRHKNKY